MPELHRWDVEPKEAVAIQRRVADRLIIEPFAGPTDRIAGIDVSIRGARVRAAIVLWSRSDRRVIETATFEDDVKYPYVPGLLSFREMPALIPAMERIDGRVDALMLDAQGIAHPRRVGLATHAGIWFDLPAIGVAKSRLTGEYEQPARMKGAATPLTDDGELLGFVLRTRTDVNPVFVSPGHRISHEQARDIALDCAVRYKLPEPTHLAHRLSKYGRL